MTLGDRPHILVVQDDLVVRDALRGRLEREGYDVTVADDGPTGLAAARDLEPDLVVLAADLPGTSGLDVCEHLRVEDGSSVPILLLTAPGGTDDRVTALTGGADDYVTTPFDAGQVALRVGSVLRRSLVPAGPRPVAGLLMDGDLTINPVSREVLQHGGRLALTTREFDLLHFLLRHPRVVHSREDLLRQVWGWEYDDDSTVTVHVSRVRRKVEPDPAAPQRLVSADGGGYRWVPTP